MGYYVNLRSAHFHVPETWSVLQVLKDLNKRDDLKQGGTYQSGQKTESWFRGIGPNYDEKCTSVQEVFYELGFDTKILDEPWGKAVSLEYYDGKAGQQELFCRAVAPFMDKGSYIEWLGEDGAEEVWVVQDGELKLLVRKEEKWWQ